MFSNTAYEAMYVYMGLALHSKFIEVITSQKVFLGVITLIFGALFFVTSVQFFSRYVPGSLIKRRFVPLSKYVRIIFCLFIGISFLRVETTTDVKRFNGDSWHNNPYVVEKLGEVPAEHKVSFLFDLLFTTAEEIARFISRTVDSVFASTHSQLDAPNFFFKAIMYGGLATIDDPDLKKKVEYYTEECFDRILPYIKNEAKENKLDDLFSGAMETDQKLREIILEKTDDRTYTCLDAKNDVRDGLKDLAWKKTQAGGIEDKIAQYLKTPEISKALTNFQASSLLVNHYIDEREGYLGVQKGSQLPTNTGKVAQFLNRLVGWNGVLSLFSARELHGVALSAERAQEFSENLARAPHLAGFIKMLVIASFPWLLFFVIAGYWRVIAHWFLIYLSVLLWTPIWTLLYHITVNIALSADIMHAFGSLSDGVSVYSADLISSRIYYLFSVYSWLQILTGTLFTGAILYFLRPALSDTNSDSAPDFVDTGKNVATTAVGLPKGVL